MNEPRILTLEEKVPPLEDLIYGIHTTEELLKEISERGRKLSATECCEYFCTPPGKKTILEGALEGTEKTIGHYSHDSKETIKYLRTQGRIKIPSTESSLIEVITSAPKNRIIIIRRNLITQRPGFKFLKKESTKNVAQKEDEPVETAFERELRKVKITDNYCGYHIQGHSWTNKTYKLIALIDLVRGFIYDSAIHTAVRVDCYAGKNPLKTGGIAAATQIPSFHDKKKEYLAGFEGIPLYKKRISEAFNQGFEISASTSSPRELWDMMKFGREIKGKIELRKGKEKRWDHHFIFAYQRIAKEFKKQGYNTLKPYLETGAPVIRFYWRLLHNCLAERWDETTQKMVLEPLKIGQAEHLLWKREGYENEHAPKTLT